MIAAALRAGIPVLNASPVLNAQLAADRRRAARLPGSPGRLQRPRPADRHQRTARSRRSASSRPAQTTCNYLTLAFRNLADALSEGNGHGNWLDALAFEPPKGPNSEGGAGLGSRQRPRAATTTSTTTPTRTPPRPGQPHECEAGNEHYETGKTVIGNAPRQPGHRRPAGSSEEGE